MTHVLEDSWNVYFHDNEDTSWSLESYKKVATLNTIEEYHNFINQCPKIKGLLVIIRNGINPLWEDPQNKNGGAYTLFFSEDEYHEYLEKISMYLVCEQMTERRSVNGISITSKHNSYSLKIWTRDASQLKFHKDLQFSTRLNYKSHF